MLEACRFMNIMVAVLVVPIAVLFAEAATALIGEAGALAAATGLIVGGAITAQKIRDEITRSATVSDVSDFSDVQSDVVVINPATGLTYLGKVNVGVDLSTRWDDEAKRSYYASLRGLWDPRLMVPPWLRSSDGGVVFLASYPPVITMPPGWSSGTRAPTSPSDYSFRIPNFVKLSSPYVDTPSVHTSIGANAGSGVDYMGSDTATNSNYVAWWAQNYTTPCPACSGVFHSIYRGVNSYGIYPYYPGTAWPSQYYRFYMLFDNWYTSANPPAPYPTIFPPAEGYQINEETGEVYDWKRVVPSMWFPSQKVAVTQAKEVSYVAPNSLTIGTVVPCNALPLTEPEVIVQASSRGRARVLAGSRVHILAPPRPGTKERKAKLTGWTAALKVGHSLTEVGDAVFAVYAALPWSVRKGHPHDTVAQRVKLLCDNWEQVDVKQAVKNLLVNEVEDRILGRMFAKAQGGPLGKHFGSGKYRPPVLGHAIGGLPK